MIHRAGRRVNEEQSLHFNPVKQQIWTCVSVDPDIYFKNQSGERSQKVNAIKNY